MLTKFVKVSQVVDYYVEVKDSPDLEAMHKEAMDIAALVVGGRTDLVVGNITIKLPEKYNPYNVFRVL